jgi:hypothetical protein
MMLIRLFAACCAIVLLAGCATFHHYAPYYGQVVEASTGEPIAGAAVLAVYYTQSYGLAGSNLEFLDAQEVVTDANGEFEVPSLNAATFRSLQSFDSWAWITIFKPGYAGYGCFPAHQEVTPKEQPFPPNQKTTIRLPKLSTREERIKYFGCYPSPSVPVEKYTNLLRLIDDEINSLASSNKVN